MTLAKTVLIIGLSISTALADNATAPAPAPVPTKEQNLTREAKEDVAKFEAYVDAKVKNISDIDYDEYVKEALPGDDTEDLEKNFTMYADAAKEAARKALSENDVNASKAALDEAEENLDALRQTEREFHRQAKKGKKGQKKDFKRAIKGLREKAKGDKKEARGMERAARNAIDSLRDLSLEDATVADKLADRLDKATDKLEDAVDEFSWRVSFKAHEAADESEYGDKEAARERDEKMHEAERLVDTAHNQVNTEMLLAGMSGLNGNSLLPFASCMMIAFGLGSATMAFVSKRRQRQSSLSSPLLA